MPPDSCPWEKPIIFAAATGELQELQQELARRGHVDTRDFEFQRTPLHWAVLNGQHAVIHLLLAHNAEVNTSEPSQGRTPLLDAIASGHSNIVKELIDAGAHVDTPDFRGETPLLCATRQGSVDISRILLEAKADPNTRDWHRGQTPLSLASEKGRDDIVYLLLDHDASAILADDQGAIPLMYALENNHAEISRVLAAKEARGDSGNVESILSAARSRLELNAVDPYRGLDDEARLMKASEDRCPEIVREVLERNVHVNVDFKDEEGRTPLSHAARDEDAEIAKMLLNRGADVDSVDEMRWTPLMVAAEIGLEAMSLLLLERGANPNSCSSDGLTPLLLAASAGCTALVSRLLDAGADPDAQDESESLTAISRAAENDDLAMVESLLVRGISPNVDDRTLLCALRERNRSETSDSNGYQLIHALVKYGADIFMDGWTDERPLVIATRHGLKDIVALFLQAEFTSARVRQEHIEHAVRVAAEEDEDDILEELMKHYVHRDIDDEQESPWDWAKSHWSAHPLELLRPYYSPATRFDSDSGPDSGDKYDATKQ